MPERSDSLGTAAIIPAAGRSRRMGVDKRILEVKGVPLLRRCVVTVLDAGLDPVLVVIRSFDHAADLRLADLPCRFVARPDSGSDMRGSLRLAITALPRGMAAMVVLPDMPAVDVTMVRKIGAERTGGIVAARYGSVVAPPVLFPPDHRADLWNAGDGFGSRLRLRDDVTLIPFPGSAGMDVDTPIDYGRLRSTVSGSSDPAVGRPDSAG